MRPLKLLSRMHTPRHDPALELYAAVRSNAERHRSHRQFVGEAARYLGALSIFLVGAVHAQHYYDAYVYVVPTIGTLFQLIPTKRRLR